MPSGKFDSGIVGGVGRRKSSFLGDLIGLRKASLMGGSLN